MAATLAGDRMAKNKAGRPSGSGGDGRETRTRPIRAYELDAEMLFWIGEVLRKGSAEILKPMIRPELTALYEQLRPQIDRLKAMRAEEERLREQAFQELDEAWDKLPPEKPVGEPPATRRPKRPPAGGR